MRDEGMRGEGVREWGYDGRGRCDGRGRYDGAKCDGRGSVTEGEV